jgi:hypothetical protein
MALPEAESWGDMLALSANPSSMHPFAIDAKRNLYVDSASATNSCQVENRMLKSPGIDPCTELR